MGQVQVWYNRELAPVKDLGKGTARTSLGGGEEEEGEMGVLACVRVLACDVLRSSWGLCVQNVCHCPRSFWCCAVDERHADATALRSQGLQHLSCLTTQG